MKTEAENQIDGKVVAVGLGGVGGFGGFAGFRGLRTFFGLGHAGFRCPGCWGVGRSLIGLWLLRCRVQGSGAYYSTACFFQGANYGDSAGSALWMFRV